MLKMFRALPPYFGGKRRLVGQIFKTLPTPDIAPTFIDAFLGGGSVSLYAKARNFRVICNDVAERSYIIGKALIENDHAKLTREDLIRFSQPAKERGYVEENLVPDVFTESHGIFLDSILTNCSSCSGIQRWLYSLILVHYALKLRPMGNWGAKTIIRQAAAGSWDEMNPNFAKDLINRGLPRHPLRLAEKLLPRINGGVFANGYENEAHKGDVFEFLANTTGDICYMDPPYSNTQSYERAMKPLDEILNGGPVKFGPNPFSVEPPEVILPKLFAAADHIPTLVLSYGNQCIDLMGLMDLMRQFRPNVTGQAINYVHCTGLSSKESKKNNQELLVIGRSQ